MFSVAKSPNIAIDTRIARIFKEKCTDLKCFWFSLLIGDFMQETKKKKKSHQWNVLGGRRPDSPTRPGGFTLVIVLASWCRAKELLFHCACCHPLVSVCPCLTSIVTHMGYMLQACFTLVLTSESVCCFRNSCDTFPQHTHISSSPEAFFSQVLFLWMQACLIVPGDVMPFFCLLFLCCLDLSLLEFPGASMVAQW